MALGSWRLKKSLRLGSMHALCPLSKFQTAIWQDAIESSESILGGQLQEEPQCLIPHDDGHSRWQMGPILRWKEGQRLDKRWISDFQQHQSRSKCRRESILGDVSCAIKFNEWTQSKEWAQATPKTFTVITNDSIQLKKQQKSRRKETSSSIEQEDFSLKESNPTV